MSLDAMTPGDLMLLMDRDGAADLLARSGLHVGSVTPVYVRIKPGELAVVGLEASVHAPSGGDVHIEGYVRTYADPARAAAGARKSLTKRPAPTAVGPGIQLLSGGRSVAFWWPNDARLQNLKQVLRTDRLKRILGELEGLGGTRVRGRSTRVTAVRYKPERRWLARVETRNEVKTARHLFVRLFADDRGARVNRVLEELSAHEIGPRAMGVALAGRLSAEEALEGADLAGKSGRGLEVDELAVLLTRCHAADLRLESSLRTALTEEESALGALGTVVTFEPRLADAAANLTQLLARRRPETSHRSTLHGDLHLGQVLSTPGGLRLVDFERAGSGDPLVDVGSMCAHLMLEGLEAPEFAEAYARRSPRRSTGETEYFTAIGLVQRALLAFRKLDEEWPSTADRALELAVDLLQRPPVRPTVLYPRPGGTWSGRGGDAEGREVFGRYNPDSGRFSPASPHADPELPGLAHWLARGELLSYRPGRRAVVRCGDRYVKVLRPKKAQRLNRRLAALTAATGDGIVRGPLEFHDVSGALVFRRCEGRSLHDRIMVDRAGLHEDLRRVGKAIASLHECKCADPAALPAPVGVDTRQWVAVVAGHFPRLAGRYARVGRVVGELPVEASCESLVHGDLHDKNVFVSDRGVELIDLDMAHVGCRVEDLGNLTAHLTLRALQSGRGGEFGSHWSRALVEGYETRGWKPPEDALMGAEARALFRLACLYLFRRRWSEITPVLLRASELRCHSTAA